MHFTFLLMFPFLPFQWFLSGVEETPLEKYGFLLSLLDIYLNTHLHLPPILLLNIK